MDTNCIIDLEQNRPSASALRLLIVAGREGRVELGVPAISASERTVSGGFLDDFSEFTDRLGRVGLASATILAPIGYWDMTYWDHFLWADDGEMVRLQEDIHKILFPEIELDYETYRSSRDLPPEKLDGRWRNAVCDDLAMWCHIYYQRDLFVTRDRNFHKASKKPRLIARGAKEILTPEEVARRV